MSFLSSLIRFFLSPHSMIIMVMLLLRGHRVRLSGKCWNNSRASVWSMSPLVFIICCRTNLPIHTNKFCVENSISESLFSVIKYPWERFVGRLYLESCNSAKWISISLNVYWFIDTLLRLVRCSQTVFSSVLLHLTVKPTTQPRPAPALHETQARPSSPPILWSGPVSGVHWLFNKKFLRRSPYYSTYQPPPCHLTVWRGEDWDSPETSGEDKDTESLYYVLVGLVNIYRDMQSIEFSLSGRYQL